jgi:periplasmic protein TonB
MERLLISKIAPEYPKEAHKQHVQGSVVIQALIGKGGDVVDLRVISGNELLVPSAIEAVKQWKYKPYVMQGQPIEVDTQITINYTLSP